MVEEAKKIAEPGSEPVHKMRRKSMFIRKDGAKKAKGIYSLKKETVKVYHSALPTKIVHLKVLPA